MRHSKTIVYKGETFYLQTTGRYYQSGRKTAPERSLHRRVWSDANGPIPAGSHLHHINGDWGDNRLENLELVNPQAHQSEHMLARMSEPTFRATALDGLKKACDAAAAWHASPEGREWHSTNGAKSWESREPVQAACSVCGGPYPTHFPTRSRFCSSACAQKEGYQRYKTATALCAHCGASFTFNRHRAQICCSRTCANRRRAAIERQ